jgi:hypothetical protein
MDGRSVKHMGRSRQGRIYDHGARSHSEAGSVDKGTCEVCGYKSELWSMQRHNIVPKELTRKTGMSESGTVGLCSNCLTELYDWYSKKVSNMSYDPITKRFGPRCLFGMINEYNTAYKLFVEYKKRQLGLSKPH